MSDDNDDEEYVDFIEDELAEHPDFLEDDYGEGNSDEDDEDDEDEENEGEEEPAYGGEEAPAGRRRDPTRIDWYSTSTTLEKEIRRYRSQPNMLIRLLNGTCAAYEAQTDFSDMWASGSVINSITQYVFEQVPHSLPATALVPACRLLAALFDENISSDMYNDSWADGALAAIERAIVAGQKSPAIAALLRIMAGGSTYTEQISTNASVMQAVSDTAIDCTDPACHKAASCLSNQFSRDAISEAEVRQVTLTLMMYITSFKESLAALAEPPSPSYYDDPNRYNEDGTVNRNVVSNPGIKTLATVFRNLSNACCDDQTGVLKSFMIEVGAIDAAIHFGTQGCMVSQLGHNCAAFVSMVAAPHDSLVPQSPVCGPIATALVQKGALDMLVRGVSARQAAAYADSTWDHHYFLGILALRTWTQDVLAAERILESCPALGPAMVSVCSQALAQSRRQGAFARGIQSLSAAPAAVFLSRYMPALVNADVTEALADVSQPLNERDRMFGAGHYRAKAWMLNPQ